MCVNIEYTTTDKSDCSRTYRDTSEHEVSGDGGMLAGKSMALRNE